MSTHENWTAVDSYLTSTLDLLDPALDNALKSSAAAGLPHIEVSAPAGRLLRLLAELQGARRILEIGTLGGFSTINLARGLAEGGRVVTLEYDPHHAEVAAANIEAAGLTDRVEIRIGKALDTLPQLELEGREPFDLAFIDADKQNNPNYVRWALRLCRPGALIVVDNVIRNGGVLDPNGDDTIQGTRATLELIESEPRLLGTAVQTVGAKGWDGFALARVLD
ncbi:O-methyltransferase [Streptacidiphilus fuscans]|uniref:O-methyltransferase n=1 Tax=Streptacidiphilus fuscans TaxID=2789292 RepID=A0A931FFL6_9ACTN|nr:O-methyltransferase [Streptacidiphilus fuscans]MBF9069996.1 O-methyltransferase [Streptacidiphilus fuscans]